MQTKAKKKKGYVSGGRAGHFYTGEKKNLHQPGGKFTLQRYVQGHKNCV